MATRGEMHPSKYLKAEDLKTGYLVTIASCIEEELNSEGRKESKYVLYFRGGSGKGLVLNVTNSDVLFDNIDPDSDNWAGHQVYIYPTTTDFGKRRNVPCLRLRMPDAAPAEPAPAPAASHDPPPPSTPVGGGQTAVDSGTGEDIPF